MLCKVTHCAGCILANTRPHQLHWGDQEMGTAISWSQVAGHIHTNIASLCPAILRGMHDNPWGFKY